MSSTRFSRNLLSIFSSPDDAERAAAVASMVGCLMATQVIVVAENRTTAVAVTARVPTSVCSPLISYPHQILEEWRAVKCHNVSLTYRCLRVLRCLIAITSFLSKPSSLFQAAAFSRTRTQSFCSSLWDAASSLIRTCLCTHSRATVNSC